MSATTLALDLATSTGWAQRLDDGKIRSGTEVLYGDAQVKLGNFLVWLENSLPTEAIVIEGGFKRGSNAWWLNGLGAIACAVAKKHRLGFHKYQPTTIKKATTGSGKASKATMQKLVRARTGIVTKTDDEADAIAVLLCHEARRLEFF